MLHNLKKSLFEIIIKIDKNVSINFEDVETGGVSYSLGR